MDKVKRDFLQGVYEGLSLAIRICRDDSVKDKTELIDRLRLHKRFLDEQYKA